MKSVAPLLVGMTSLIVLAVFGLIFFSSDMSDKNMTNHVTYLSLYSLGHYLKDAFEKGIEFQGIDSIKDVLLILSKNGLIGEEDVEHFEKDNWGRPFRIMTERGRELKRIIILSDGANGLAEIGNGDDLFVEVVKERNQLTMRLRKVYHNGKTELIEVDH